MKLSSTILLSILVTLSAAPAHAANRCESIFTSWIEQTVEAPPTTRATLRLLGNIANIQTVMSFTEARSILDDKDLPFYGEILRESAELANKRSVAPSIDVFKNAIRSALQKRLYTEELIDERLAMIDQSGPRNWRTILGDLSLTDTRRLYYGEDIRQVSPNSLLGQYLAKTGASTRLINFKENYEAYDSEGPTKLLVAVSQDSFADLQTLFLNSPNYMTIIGHAATLFNGMYYPNEGGKGARVPRLPHMNERMPILLMKTTEAQRFARYTALTADPKFDGWHDGLKRPWLNDSYCAVGGYSCCTHWIGNIPIGDKLVPSYTFPANWESPNGDRTPMTKSLTPYTPPVGKEELATVWKVPGHEQLADVIGQRASNLAGDLASPGSVQMVLYARTSAARVPIVFYVVEDHRAPIPASPEFFSEPIK